MAGWPHRRGPRRHDTAREVPAARQEPGIGAGAADQGPTVADVVHDLADHGWSVESIADALNTSPSRVGALLAGPRPQPAALPADQDK